MHTKTCAYSLFLYCGTVNAQPTITTAAGPIAGQQVTYLQTNEVPTVLPGASQTWTVQGTMGPSGQDDYLTPASTIGGMYFPDATVASSSGSSVSYYVVNSGGLYLTGIYDEQDETLRDLVDTWRTLAYPCTFGTTWSDGWSSSPDPNGTPDDFLEPITYTADGYGTLVGNGGQLTNVLKVHYVIANDSLYQDGTYTESTRTTDVFWHAAYHYWVARASHVVNVLNGEVVFDSYLTRLIEELATGIEGNELPTFGMRLEPNPAAESVLVTCGVLGSTTITVLNTLGEEVLRSVQPNLPPGIHQTRLDIASLSPGPYVVRITTANGEAGVRKLMIER